MERSSPALDRRRNAPARNPGSSGRHSENATCRGPLQAERRVPYFLLFAPSHQAFYRTRKQHVGSLLHQRLLRVSRADFFVPWLTFLLSSASALPWALWRSAHFACYYGTISQRHIMVWSSWRTLWQCMTYLPRKSLNCI